MKGRRAICTLPSCRSSTQRGIKDRSSSGAHLQTSLDLHMKMKCYRTSSHSLLLAATVLLVLGVCIQHNRVQAGALSEEEKRFLAAEFEAWINSRDSPKREQRMARLVENPSYNTYMERRLRNSADAAKGRGAGTWNSMGMNNLFRLDKRSVSRAEEAGNY